MSGAGTSGRPSKRRLLTDWRVILGFAITFFLLWWVLRDVAFGEVLREIADADLLLLGISISIATAGFLVRAMRWEVLLRPLHGDTALHSRFAAVNIGFMANNLLPLRVGEFARAYALSRMEVVRMSGAFGSLAVERFLDAFTILLLLVASVLMPQFPEGATLGGRSVSGLIQGLGAVVGVILLGLVVLLVWPAQLVSLVEKVGVRLLPADSRRRVVDTLEAFLEGITSLRDPRLLLLAIAWSVGFWLFHSFAFWVGFQAFGIEVSYVAAIFVNCVVAFAVAVPSSPGFFGTFHAGVALALVGVFGVAEGPTLGFAFGFHLGGFIPVTLLGLYYAWSLGLTLHEIEATEERVEEEFEREHPEVAEKVMELEAGGEQEP